MLELYILIGSLIGVSSMVAMTYFMKTWTPASLESLDDARHRLNIDAVGFEAGQAALSTDGKVALVEEQGGHRIGLLAARGDGIVIRYLQSGMIKGARMGEDAALRIGLRDFTFAPVIMKFGDNETSRLWADKLNAMQG
jgi:hypothetical protein